MGGRVSLSFPRLVFQTLTAGNGSPLTVRPLAQASTGLSLPATIRAYFKHSIACTKTRFLSSHPSNLATYATLFGMPWLEPLLWKFQQWLYSK